MQPLEGAYQVGRKLLADLGFSSYSPSKSRSHSSKQGKQRAHVSCLPSLASLACWLHVRALPQAASNRHQ